MRSFSACFFRVYVPLFGLHRATAATNCRNTPTRLAGWWSVKESAITCDETSQSDRGRGVLLYMLYRIDSILANFSLDNRII